MIFDGVGERDSGCHLFLKSVHFLKNRRVHKPLVALGMSPGPLQAMALLAGVLL